MLKIAICDDDRDVVANIENMLCQQQDREIEYDIFFTGEDMLSYMERNTCCYDMYLLDIEMPGLNGQEVAKRIRITDMKALIIFITTHVEFMEDAFDVQAFHFLRKPLNENKFMELMNKAYGYLGKTKRILTVKHGKKQQDIICDEIIFMESDKRKMIAYTMADRYEFYMSVGEVLAKLDTRFFVRVHGSFVVNLQYIKEFTMQMLLMENGYHVPISRGYQNEFKEAYREYIKMRI